jgi:hypothetical protein
MGREKIKKKGEGGKGEMNENPIWLTALGKLLLFHLFIHESASQLQLLLGLVPLIINN